jgi:chromosomal replication initiator protein
MESGLLRLFGCGLTVCIEPPDFETRVRVLERRALYLGQSMPKEVVVFIAHKVKGNVRELEGIQNALFAHARYNGEELNLELAHRISKKYPFISEN